MFYRRLFVRDVDSAQRARGQREKQKGPLIETHDQLSSSNRNWHSIVRNGSCVRIRGWGKNRTIDLPPVSAIHVAYDIKTLRLSRPIQLG